MLRSYSLRHNQGDKLLPLMVAYRDVVNNVIGDIWKTIRWKKTTIKGKGQFRLIPYYDKSNGLRRGLRDKYLANWSFATHWVDSALKTAFSMMDSWRKNYLKGDGRRQRPTARRLFIRVKQTLCKLEGDRLRITIDGKGEYAYIDLSRRYFRLPTNISSSGMGEPVVTPDMIYLPIHYEDEQVIKPAPKMAWDFNLLSIDGFSPETGWIRIDTRALASAHISAFEKRRSVQRKTSKARRARLTLRKYSRRERNKTKKHQIEIARVVASLAYTHTFEDLRKKGMYTNSRIWNRRVSRTDWRGIVRRVKEVGCSVVEVEPAYTSKTCSRCGWINRDLRGAVFECRRCGLRLDRQLNGAINLYLKMEGVPHRVEWWDENILPSLVGGYVLTGAERKAPNEPVRGLYEAVKPQLYYAYDRYADAYLRMPMQSETQPDNAEIRRQPPGAMGGEGRTAERRPFIVRELRKEDLGRGFLETLLNLSPVSPHLLELHEKIFEARSRLMLHYGGRRIPVYRTVVAVTPDSEVIATATLFAELKHIHDGGLVGHIEDVSRRSGEKYRGMGAGRACVEELIRFGREIGCYKIILDCSERNVPFYESLGFRRHEVAMRMDLVGR